MTLPDLRKCNVAVVLVAHTAPLDLHISREARKSLVGGLQSLIAGAQPEVQQSSSEDEADDEGRGSLCVVA